VFGIEFKSTKTFLQLMNKQMAALLIFVEFESPTDDPFGQLIRTSFDVFHELLQEEIYS
jgi:hypothetical protein